MTPRDWDSLTVEEEDALLHWVDEYIKESEKAHSRARSRR